MRRYAQVVLVVALLAGSAVRLAGLGPRSWWIDELITRDVARLALWSPAPIEPDRHLVHSIVGFALHDTGPGPLTYLLDGALASWAEPLGREALLRLPSVFAGILFLILLAVFSVRHGGGVLGALVTVAGAAVWPAYVEWSTTARGYSWLLVATLLQFWLLVSIGTPPDSGRGNNTLGKARTKWAGLCTLSIVGCLLNPLHTVWNAAIFVAAVTGRFGLKCSGTVPESGLQKLDRPAFWSGIVLSCAANLAWVAVWIPVFFTGAKRHQDAGPVIQHLIAVLGEAPRNPETAGAIGAMVFSAFVASALFRTPRRRMAALIIAIATALMVPVALMATMKQFLLLRYFYALTVPVFWGIGLLLSQRIRLDSGGTLHRFLVHVPALFALALILGLLPYSFRLAHTPQHDWAGVVRFLEKESAPGEPVLCGPNADFEILRVYAEAGGLRVALPRFVNTSDGGRLDAFTREGVDAILASADRVWFVTPYWGQVRPADYWEFIAANFTEVAAIPGRTAIRVMRHTKR